MAILKTENIKISGISACVPKQVEENSAFPLFDRESLKNFVATTGIERKRKAPDTICSSDLCISAAEALIAGLRWNKADISILVFVTMSPDYIVPSTAPLIQDRLGLSKECYALDISLGCSGWVYGMSAVAGLLHSTVHDGAKALLLMGDTTLKMASKEDKSVYPLFGEAGTATALEYISEIHTTPLLFNMNSDGSGYKSIFISDGGCRNPFSLSSLNKIVRGEGIVSNNVQITLEGLDVFSFGIKEVPKSVNKLIDAFNLDKEMVDYFIFHQANLFMNEQIRKKLKLPPEKVPYSLKNFGNTSGSSIPLTMVTQLRKELIEKTLHHIASGFGVGLSWGSIYFATDHIVCPPLVEI